MVRLSSLGSSFAASFFGSSSAVSFASSSSFTSESQCSVTVALSSLSLIGNVLSSFTVFVAVSLSVFVETKQNPRTKVTTWSKPIFGCKNKQRHKKLL